MPANPGYQVQRFLSRADYPTNKQELIARARAQSDDERARVILPVLDTLPSEKFRSLDDVTKAIARIPSFDPGG